MNIKMVQALDEAAKYYSVVVFISVVISLIAIIGTAKWLLYAS